MNNSIYPHEPALSALGYVVDQITNEQSNANPITEVKNGMNKTARVIPDSQSRTGPNSDRGESHPVPEEVIRQFAGNLRLNEIHCVGARLVVTTEIAEGLLAGELDSEWFDTLSALTRELSSDQTSPFIVFLLTAIEKHEQLPLLIRAVNAALNLTVNYTRREFSDDAVFEINQLRLAVFQQRQKRRSELKSGRHPVRKAKAATSPFSVDGYERAYVCSSNGHGGKRERLRTDSVP